MGLVREVESEIARSRPNPKRLHESWPGWSCTEFESALETLLAEGRVTREKNHLVTAARYLVLSSDKFHHRIDALNHFLGGVTRAVAQRLLFEDREQAMIKTISFVARPERFQELLRTLEANLRREIAALEEDAQFEGEGKRYVLGLFAAHEAAERPEAETTADAP
jgi:hypothetical protein